MPYNICPDPTNCVHAQGALEDLFYTFTKLEQDIRDTCAAQFAHHPTQQAIIKTLHEEAVHVVAHMKNKDEDRTLQFMNLNRN